MVWVYLFTSLSLWGQVSGHVFDARTRQPLANANVFDYITDKGTVTDTLGFFSLRLDADSAYLRISYVGYHEALLHVRLPLTRPLEVWLEPGEQLPQAEITALRDREAFFAPDQVESMHLLAKDVLVQPVLIGEPDLLRTLATLPGVQMGLEGQSSIFVRGGLRDQNLLLIDGEPLYYANHVFGFLSVFNPDVVRDIHFYRGGFPARYGGRLSAVIDVSVRPGADTAWQWHGGIGLISGRLTGYGPVSDRMTLLVGARRTWIDLLLAPFSRRNGLGGKAYFHDYNLKLTYRPSSRWHFWATSYWGQDLIDVYVQKLGWVTEPMMNELIQVTLNEDGYLLSWGNRIAAVGGTYYFGDSLWISARVGVGHSPMEWGFSTHWAPDTDSSQLQNRWLQASISDRRLHLWGVYARLHHQLESGLYLMRHAYRPFSLQFSLEGPGFAQYISEKWGEARALEGAWYVQDKWAYGPWSGMVGLRLSGLMRATYRTGALEPRLVLRYMWSDKWALYGTLTRMMQYSHLAHGMRIALPTDRWLPASAQFPPQSSWQYALQLKGWWDARWRLETGPWYKRMQNIVMYADGADPTWPIRNEQDMFARGSGYAFGWELSGYTERDNWSLRMHYTYSRAQVHFPRKNGGRPFFHPFDRRHKVDIAWEWHINDRMRFSAVWVFATGNPLIVPAYRVPNTTEYYIYSTPDERRNRPLHRLDLSLQRSKRKKRFLRTWIFGLYNAYSRRNPLYVDVLNPPGKEKGLYELTLFPILPFVAFQLSTTLLTE